MLSIFLILKLQVRYFYPVSVQFLYLSVFFLVFTAFYFDCNRKQVVSGMHPVHLTKENFMHCSTKTLQLSQIRARYVCLYLAQECQQHDCFMHGYQNITYQELSAFKCTFTLYKLLVCFLSLELGIKRTLTFEHANVSTAYCSAILVLDTRVLPLEEN